MAAAVPVPVRVLAIGAHPDDVDFGCGGTLARWAQAGTVVAIAVLTDGSMGSHDPGVSAAALSETRAAEQRAAARVLGADEVRFLGGVDGSLSAAVGIELALAAVIREVQPEIVLTHDPWSRDDLHPDHPVAGRRVIDALFLAREPRAARELAARGLASWRPRELWLWGGSEPDELVDISAQLTRKLAALLCHRSQRATTMGLAGEPSATELAGFAERLVERARRLSPDGSSACEAFRRLTLVQ